MPRSSSERAHSDGWFLGKNGAITCPDHLPEWVTAWRARNQKEKS